VRRSILLAGLALAGCEVYSVPGLPECPGTKVGGFVLALQYSDAGSTCPPNVKVNPALRVAATLTSQPDGGAAICLDRPHAVPLLGTRTGDHVLVRSADPDSPVSGCTCVVSVVTEIEGDVLRDGDGGFVDFTARWRDALAAPDGGVCGCGLPCLILYTPDGGA
jgi:hypothetical protein